MLSERGTPLSYMGLYSKIHRIGRETGVTRLSLGALRFAFLRRLYDKAQDMRYVQEQAGHAHLKTTARYIKALTQDQDTTPPALSNGHAHRKGRQQCRDETGVRPGSPGGRGPGVRGSLSHQNRLCESCGRPVAATEGTHIDSGQLACATSASHAHRGPVGSWQGRKVCKCHGLIATIRLLPLSRDDPAVGPSGAQFTR